MDDDAIVDQGDIDKKNHMYTKEFFLLESVCVSSTQGCRGRLNYLFISSICDNLWVALDLVILEQVSLRGWYCIWVMECKQ